jgi:hypothetical protein
MISPPLQQRDSLLFRGASPNGDCKRFRRNPLQRVARARFRRCLALRTACGSRVVSVFADAVLLGFTDFLRICR